jgi:hypothetical protein
MGDLPVGQNQPPVRQQDCRAHRALTLISTQPDADSCQLDEGEVVGCKFAVAGGDTPTPLDLVEEPLDEITPAVQASAKTNWLLSSALRSNIGPRVLFSVARDAGARVRRMYRSSAPYRTQSNALITHVGLIRKKQTTAPSYIPQLAKVCRAPQAIAIWSISRTETTKA